MEVKPVKTSCCKSFLLPKGRCFDCVAEEWKDPDEEL
jgi:hypothetical protein